MLRLDTADVDLIFRISHSALVAVVVVVVDDDDGGDDEDLEDGHR